MRGYLRVFLRSLEAAVASWTEYRLDFLAALLTSLLEAVGRVVAALALVRAGVLELEPAGALVYLGVATVTAGFFAGVVGPNLTAFSQRILEGTLEFVLLRPRNPVFLLLVETASPWGVSDLVAGAVLLGYGLFSLGAGWGGVFLGALALSLGLLIAYLSAFALALVGFFSVYVHNLINLISGVFGAGQYPLRAYAAPVRVLLTFVVPVYLAVNLPAEVFLGAVGPGALWAMGAFWCCFGGSWGGSFPLAFGFTPRPRA